MARTCLNCGADISHRDIQAKTCDDACRRAYSRKQRTAKKITQIVREAPHGPNTNPPDAATLTKQVVEDEVRAAVKPVVREALTEDVLTALQDLVRLTPDAVTKLGEQINGQDPVLAQKAATTVLRYTVGHTAIVTPAETNVPQ